MRKIALLIIILFSFITTVFADNTFKFEFDKSGYISDNANVLQKSDVERMAYWLSYLEKHKHISIILVTLEELKGAPASQVAHYALEYGGNENKDNTLIFVVSPFENKFGIEIGDNVKSEISYATLRKIIKEDIYPHFQDGNYSFALKNGVFSISNSIEPSLIFVKDVNLEKEVQKTDVSDNKKSAMSVMSFYIFTIILLVLLMLAYFILRAIDYKKSIKIYRRCGFGVKFGEVV